MKLTESEKQTIFEHLKNITNFRCNCGCIYNFTIHDYVREIDVRNNLRVVTVICNNCGSVMDFHPSVVGLNY
jgi:hypothetical protein